MKYLLSISLFFLSVNFLSASDVMPGKVYKISTAFTDNKILSVPNSSLDDSNLIIWTDTEVNSQRWRITEDETGEFYYLTNMYTGKVLHVTGLVSSSARINQYSNDKSKGCKWNISSTGDERFYISPASEPGGVQYYLEVNSADEGSELKVNSKKDGDEAMRQIWMLEPQDEEYPVIFTSTIRDDIMAKWKAFYYKDMGNQAILGKGGWWGDAEMFEIILDAYETTGNPEYKEMFTKLYTNFTVRNGTDWSGNNFNDDIAWMVIACVRAYLLFGEQTYLTRAKSNFDTMYNRALLTSGMLRWQENNPEVINQTNSCINGPAEVALCYLAIATNNDAYFEKAKKLYDLQRRYLYAPQTGQVYDCFTWVNGVPSNYSHWASTYNQGTFLGAALMLFNRYGDEQYKEDARTIMKYTVDNLCNKEGIIKVCQIATGDLTGFKGILMRYVRRLIVDLGEIEHVDWMQKNTLHAYNNRNSKGVICSAWLSKSPENFIFDGNNFTSDPFGPSTAVSVAFNTPLDKNSIKKDAFTTIQAENFNYLKGVFTGQTMDMTVLENLKNGYWTAYNHVDFGDNTAKSIEFKISNNNSEGSIEIHLDSPTGTLIGSDTIPAFSDNWNTWHTVGCNIEPIEGIKNIYLVYKGSGNLFKLDSFKFNTQINSLRPDINQTTGFNIYPNPAGNHIYINTPEPGQIYIYDICGKFILTQPVKAGGLLLDVSQLKQGVYIAKMKFADSEQSQQLVKQ